MTKDEIIAEALRELEAMPVPRPHEVARAMTYLQQTPKDSVLDKIAGFPVVWNPLVPPGKMFINPEGLNPDMGGIGDI